MVKKKIFFKRTKKRIQVPSTGIRRMVLPILSDTDYKYKKIEVDGMCMRIQKNLAKSSHRATNELNSIVVLK